MAEIALAFGVAANAIQFIDLGSKVFSVFRSNRHETALKLVAQDLQQVSKSLQSSISQKPQKPLTENDVQLLELAKKCQNICLDLLTALDKLNIPDERWKWSTFRAALKTVWSESKIESLQSTMDAYRQELVIRILLALRDQASNAADAQSPSLRYGEIFVKHLEECKSWQEHYIQDCEQWRAELVKAIRQGAGGAWERPLDPLTNEKQLRHKFINRLRFSEIQDRQYQISVAHRTTFQWIWREHKIEHRPWASFAGWLSTNEDLYWIAGKAGSGKSTLMKYLYHDERTFLHLRKWAGNTQLVTAAFFFWNSGTNIQMSQLGLLRTLLFQVLKCQPELIPRVLPQRWEVHSLFDNDEEPWTLLELQQAFAKLTSYKKLSAKYCFFIDGLDEFSGDHSQLIQLVKGLGRSRNVKICVSSRPWVVFEDAFERTPSLMLQDLTSSDIQQYVQYKFTRNSRFLELCKREPAYAGRLLQTICDKSAGVFLWVTLVVSSLLTGMSNGDRVSDLQERLDLLPPDLENLFRKMFTSLDPFYLEHASELFQLARATPDRRTLFLSYGDETVDNVLGQQLQPHTKREQIERIEVMRRRLNSRCKGLLEIVSDKPRLPRAEIAVDSALYSKYSQYPLLNSTVQYLHRTVKDFIQSEDVWQWLIAATKQKYDPDLALCKSYVMQFKVTPHETLETAGIWTTAKACIRHARRSSNITSNNPRKEQQLVALLDEMNRAAEGQVAKIYGKGNRSQLPNVPTSYPPWWTTPFNSATEITWTGETFLSLMVKADVRSFVRAKAEYGCLVEQSTRTRPLLFDACLQANDIQPLLGVEFPSPEMIELLLEKGADPNATIPGLKGTVLDNICQSRAVHPAALKAILNKTHIEREPSEPHERRQLAPYIVSKPAPGQRRHLTPNSVPHPVPHLESPPARPPARPPASLSKPLPALPPAANTISTSPHRWRNFRYMRTSISNTTSTMRMLLFGCHTRQADF